MENIYYGLYHKYNTLNIKEFCGNILAKYVPLNLQTEKKNSKVEWKPLYIKI